MISTIHLIDRFNAWFGKAFAWLIVVMTIGVSFEVFSRYLFNAPTSWAFDISYMMYGALFMMGGAYALATNAHVRGDFLYRLWSVKWQARVECVLFFIFYFPGVLALIFAGWKYAERSYRFTEVSVMSPAGVPIFQFKMLIVAAGILLFLQGIAQVMRCIVAMRTGAWVPHNEDVEELEDKILREAAEKGLGGGQPRPVAEQEITESTAQDAADYDAAHQDDRSWRR
ncbi:MAG: TRAP transporter small permease subunit [Pseudomonadota bacterium]